MALNIETTLEDTLSVYRNTARSFGVTIAKDAEVRLDKDGGAYVYSKKVRQDGKWIDSWIHVSDNNALTYLYRQPPEQYRELTLEQLADNLDQNGIFSLEIDEILIEGAIGEQDLIWLYDDLKDLDFSLGGVSLLLQAAATEVQAAYAHVVRPRS